MSTLATRFGSNSNVIRSHNPLSDEQIMFVAPSVYATEQHASRSERYTYIPTSFILQGLRDEGFQPFFAAQSKTRDANNAPFTKHMLRLRHESQINADSANEIILVNSHNGASSYQLLAGVYRFVCHNGLICGEEIADYRVRHSGDVRDKVIEGAFEVLDTFSKVDESMEMMKSISLTQDQQRAFAKAALTLRFDSIDNTPITEDAVLSHRRTADKENDVWTVFNRTQENLLKGGIRGRNKEHKLVTTRAVNGMDSNVKLNRALWVLSEEMAKLAA
jgi:Domain of unknown function (DUF932)